MTSMGSAWTLKDVQCKHFLRSYCSPAAGEFIDCKKLVCHLFSKGNVFVDQASESDVARDCFWRGLTIKISSVLCKFRPLCTYWCEIFGRLVGVGDVAKSGTLIDTVLQLPTDVLGLMKSEFTWDTEESVARKP